MAEQLPGHDLTILPEARYDPAGFRGAMADAEGVVVNSNVTVDEDVMAGAPRLRVISTMSVGLDHIDLDAAKGRAIVVTFTPVLSDAVADVTVALLIMLSRCIPAGIRYVAGGGWGDADLGGDLADKELLLVGFGRIGHAVAARALAMSMRVHYVDVRDGIPPIAGVERARSLGEGLTRADFVSLHVDLNQRTRHLMGSSEFAAMKRTAFFVNTSRGGVVDQEALVRALTEGSIAGAGLDVLEDEPPKPDDPILHAPNTIILPHIGSATTETRAAMARCAVDNLLKGLRREENPFSVP
jgi:phosphoglycerate dehydrogenase-like enzyme